MVLLKSLDNMLKWISIDRDMELKLIITDFDGTLVDTFEANYRAYQEAFALNKLVLNRDDYQRCFGYRYNDFMKVIGVTDDNVKKEIRRVKGEVYPYYFKYLQPNEPLINFIKAFHGVGQKTAIASTARRLNLVNALTYLRLTNIFDCIWTGEDVKYSKPDPEIYLKAMNYMKVQPCQTLIFEDSEIGCEAAEASGAHYIKISSAFYGN